MDERRIEFLFGGDGAGEGWDLDDPDEREIFLDQWAVGLEDDLDDLDDEVDPEGGIEPALRRILAAQVLGDDPPETWATVERLLGTGMEPSVVHDQMIFAIGEWIASVMEQQPIDHRQLLARLPLPLPADVEPLALELAGGAGTSLDELLDAISARLGLDAGAADDPARRQVEAVVDELALDGRLAMLSDERVVSTEELTATLTLTFRADPERHGDLLVLGANLAPFAAVPEVRLADGTLVRRAGHGHDAAWADLPALAEHADGALVAMRVDRDSVVTFEAVDPEPAADEALVAVVRSTYDRVQAELGMSVDAADLVLEIHHADPTLFGTARLPFGEVLVAAGLEERRGRVAHSPEAWYRDSVVARAMAAGDMPEAQADVVLGALAMADATAGVPWAMSDDDGEPREPRTDELRDLLRALEDMHLISALLNELLDTEVPVELPGEVAATLTTSGTSTPPAVLYRGERFAAALRTAAGRPQEAARAGFVAALVAERSADPERSEELLAEAHLADPDFAPATDRLAWCASDRGDGATALRLWSRLVPTEVIAADIAAIRAAQAGPAGAGAPKLGRNDPCWCGSGRKFKQCHQRAQGPVPLPDRMGWLCRKAAAYIARRGGHIALDTVEVAAARAGSYDRAAVEAAMGDPLVVDLVLTEGGWFEEFLVERGALLPDDERRLVRSWLPVARTVYEVRSTEPGRGVTVRDLRTDEVTEVRERTPSRTLRPGELVCARALPDGESHQFVGGLIEVPPGTEDDVLALLETGDPGDIAAWASTR